jgi:hypothetical protein
VLDVFHTIEVSIVVNVAIERHKLSSGFCGCHASATHTLDGAGLVATIGSQLAVIESGEVGWLAGLYINQ